MTKTKATKKTRDISKTVTLVEESFLDPTEATPTNGEPGKKLGAITDRQVEILLYVHDSIAKDSLDRSPSYRKIGSRFGISPGNAFGHVEALRERGLVYTARDADSAIEMTDDGRSVVETWRAAQIETRSS